LENNVLKWLKNIFLFSPKEPKYRFVLDDANNQDDNGGTDTSRQAKKDTEAKNGTQPKDEDKVSGRKAKNGKKTVVDGVKQPIPINEMNEKKREKKKKKARKGFKN